MRVDFVRCSSVIVFKHINVITKDSRSVSSGISLFVYRRLHYIPLSVASDTVLLKNVHY